MKCSTIGLQILLGFVLGFSSAFAQPVTGTSHDLARRTPDFVCCRVIYDNIKGPESSVTGDEIRVATEGLGSLPSQPREPRRPEASALGLGDFHGKVINHVSAKNGALIETYEGDFTQVVAGEQFAPVGEKIILRPQPGPGTWWPALQQGSPEIFTAALPAKHLRAVWWSGPLLGTNALSPSQYFAIAVQLYERQRAIRTAIFTGRKIVEKDALILKNKTVTELKNAEIKVEGTAWKPIDIHPRGTAFKNPNSEIMFGVRPVDRP